MSLFAPQVGQAVPSANHIASTPSRDRRKRSTRAFQHRPRRRFGIIYPLPGVFSRRVPPPPPPKTLASHDDDSYGTRRAISWIRKERICEKSHHYLQSVHYSRCSHLATTSQVNWSMPIATPSKRTRPLARRPVRPQPSRWMFQGSSIRSIPPVILKRRPR
jgi:hypothetical protein